MKIALKYLTGARLKPWISAARLPFHLVGILPFLTGISMAESFGYRINWNIFFLSVLAVEFIMLASYLLGEYYDFDTDKINCNYNFFSGGGRAFINDQNPPLSLLIISYILILFSLLLGYILQYYFHTGPHTIILGTMGIVSGVFYSARPFQWAYKGVGEIVIGFCYGWLTVNTGYYLTAGSFHSAATMISIPIGLSIFNVILINEFPDYHADKKVEKMNLVVRFGRTVMGHLYTMVILVSFLFLLYNMSIPKIAIDIIYLLPVFLLGGANFTAMYKKLYFNKYFLEKICAGSIIFNLYLSTLYMLKFLD